MKLPILKYLAIATFSLFVFSCNNDDNMNQMTTDFSGTFVQKDQMGRPAVNTVFVSSASKNTFNTTVPSQQGAAFQSMFQTNLMGLSPAFANAVDKNALGLDAASFTRLLATDVLNVSLDGKTTFFDGTNVLTGRALADDVITVELLLIFGGEDFSENPTLSNDNVDANDKPFLTSFPYLASPW
ncbi:MAG: DUF4331 domain-containing protein [Flavobacteriia bacterium]|nr:DUF4331 domain-containing protein [Flavobacteriia bacterium]PIX12870.1 MAG: hypothetical protein COZ74_09175 [Flavobacteriaceae bacterium CG_4_8_14_3_um_filter_31_8]PIY13762.1 MAG: hypothetical protein COZ16_12745 [Flavobacteriaceae bacterium CG_4_10_14_3_um_filter_31_253]PIZ12368.1 MAG: hypothetical protein COY55_00130 [Flavobacteriaceae bacterium CG_4_10_14_0_8_um_filter_31_99]PJC11319.1 MAG: hypothetical protein CO067_00045 [Flavobacteriaceae bacterium CG_4_9_14_0_8_um_filter_31_91]